jgi:hypothetical protein
MPAERRHAMCREYNGWRNYQTWALNVHGYLDDRDDLEELAAETYRESDGEHLERRADACYAVENRLREMIDELEAEAAELGLSPMLQDVLGAALGAVDVHTLAAHLVDDAPDVPHEATPATAGTE